MGVAGVSSRGEVGGRRRCRHCHHQLRWRNTPHVCQVAGQCLLARYLQHPREVIEALRAGQVGEALCPGNRGRPSSWGGRLGVHCTHEERWASESATDSYCHPYLCPRWCHTRTHEHLHQPPPPSPTAAAPRALQKRWQVSDVRPVVMAVEQQAAPAAAQFGLTYTQGNGRRPGGCAGGTCRQAKRG